MRLPLLLKALLVPIFAASFVAVARADGVAGQFDHYLLSLSWIPAYCAADGDARDDPRCAQGQEAGWAVHGLWPQYADGGWPEYCHTDQRDPSRRETREQAALFGTSGSAWHQWHKHGVCTGLSAQNYYRLVRVALDHIRLPDVFQGVHSTLRVDPDVVEAAFIEANPGLTHDMLATSCQGGDLVEIRVCLSRDLQPQRCDAQTLRRECRLNAAVLLPLR